MSWFHRIFLSGNSYVSKEALENLKHYKYASVDDSPFSYYVLRHYWNWSVQWFPLWMAPNLITLLGLMFVIVNVVLVIIYDPSMKGPYPSWMYFSFALGIWLYSTFDNVDGKQARRTNSSSPLGELFDHGCDALNCSLGSVLQIAGMGFGTTQFQLLIPFLAIMPFYLSTWEEYHTKVLYLGVVNGPTEGLVIAALSMVLSGIYGPEIWFMEIKDTIFMPLIPRNFIHFRAADVLGFGMIFLLCFVHTPVCVYKIYNATRAKNRNRIKVVAESIPILIYFVSCYFWLLSPYSCVYEKHYLLFLLSVGIVFGRIATKIILAHVTLMPFPFFTVQLIPLVIGAVGMNLPFFGLPAWSMEFEVLYLKGFFCFVMFSYFHWALLVIDRFCKHLKIKCLSIPYKKKD